MRQIMNKIKKNFKQNNKESALVTIVASSGSTYRKPGAKMVVNHNGEYEGMISGGCLEEDVSMHAQSVLRKKKNQIVAYELDDDAEFGLGLGCGGTINVMIEWDAFKWLPFILKDDTKDYVVVKKIYVNNIKEEPRTIFLYHDDKIIWKENKEKEIFNPIVYEYCNKMWTEKKSSNILIEEEGTQIQYFFDYIHASKSLVVFGGGDDAVPLVKIAKQVGFDISIVDFKPKNLERDQFKDCKKYLWTKTQMELPSLTKETSIVIMSHHLERDALALERFYKNGVYRYIGLLGPSKRLDKLTEYFKDITIQEIRSNDKIYSPVGLDIGSETPEEIGISIISEIISVYNQMTGESLKHKNGNIHE